MSKIFHDLAGRTQANLKFPLTVVVPDWLEKFKLKKHKNKR